VDYGDLDSVRGCFKQLDFDAIVHCGGAVRALSKKDYFEANVENTVRLCKAVLEIKPNLKKFVFISSQAAMGASKSMTPKGLDELETPVSDYGLSKLIAEKEIKRLLGGKIPYTILRPASVFGQGDKDIFIFFNLVHHHLKPMTLKKRYLQLVFVEDVAKAVAASLYKEGTDSKTYFLAQMTPYTWEGLAKTIAKGADIKTMPLLLPDFVFHIAAFIAQNLAKLAKKPAILNKQKINEMLQDYWIADSTPAQRDLGIDFTLLEKATAITYNWYVKNEYF
jgi:nucleoside-diphosphate-sugar epimerase